MVKNKYKLSKADGGITMKKQTIWIILSIVILSLFTSCAKKEPEVIKIGAILPLTGPQSMLGEEVKNGMQLAYDEIKKEGIQLLIEDSKDSPKDAIMSFTKLLNQNVKAIICAGDVVTLNLIPFADKEQMPLITVVGAGPEITGKSKWVFRFFVRGDYQAKVLAHYSYNELRVRKVGILYINNEYGIATLKNFKEMFENMGGKIVATESYGIADRDMRSQILKLITKNPDAIYLTGFGESYPICIKQIRELGYKGLLLSSECELSRPTFRPLTLPASENAYYVDIPYEEDSKEEVVVQFRENYKNKFNQEPSFFGVFAYDCLRNLAFIVKQSKGDKEKIRELLSSQKLIGILGEYSFNQQNDLTFPLIIRKIQNGKPVYIKKYENIPKLNN